MARAAGHSSSMSVPWLLAAALLPPTVAAEAPAPREQGWNPDKWFGHVERAMLLLEKPQYYRRARHGYCRGSEPVKYVSEIQTRYGQYVDALPH